MPFSFRARSLWLVLATSCTTLAAPGVLAATTVVPVKPLAPAASVASSGAAALITRILDRWQPVSNELKEDASVWRAQFKAVLDRASLQTLQSIDAQEARDGGVNRTLVQAYRYAYMSAVADAGARLNADAKASGALKLGTPGTDLVFVPMTPCRVVDTRNTGGVIGANQVANFYFYSNGTPASWSQQGGEPGATGTACPVSTLSGSGGTLGTAAPAAAMATVTAVNTSAAGNFNIWGGGPPSSVPNVSGLNWDHAGEIIANTTVIPWGGRTGGNLDFAVRYNGPSGFSDVVVDVVGYFVENAATALDCTTTSQAGTIAIGTGSDTTIVYPACPAGYTKSGGYCNGGGSTGTSGVYLIESGAAACIFRNLGSADVQGNAISQCCRVPGR